jgi:hypothetical protein
VTFDRFVARYHVHTAATVTATVDVPKDAPSGNDNGVIWAEQDSKGAGNVNLVSRVGLRMYPNIGPGGAPAPGFTAGTPVTFTLSSKLPDGPWQATFTFKSDLITRTEKVTLNLAAGSATAAKPHKSFPIIPVAGGIGLFLLLAIGAFFIVRHRRMPSARHA